MLRIFLFFIGIFILFAIFFYFRVRITDPQIADKKILDSKREQLGENFYKINNSWLRKSESGLWEMYVEGNGFERGVTEGMLHKELAAYQEEAFVSQIRKLVPSEWMLHYLKYFIAWFNRDLDHHIPSEYLEEIYGESLFASDDYDFIAPKYHRMLNYHAAHDIGHAIQDKHMMVGCTSFGVWDENSADSGLLIGRNFDFYVGDAFAQNKIVNFIKPQKGYAFMMLSWAGMIGAVSGMNVKGITVTINASKSEIPTGAATPISILAREILQYASNIAEAKAIAEKRTLFVSESILVGSAIDHKTIIIEKNPSQTAFFDQSEQHRMICSNHFQSDAFRNEEINLENKKMSSSEYRSKRMEELIRNHPVMKVSDAVEILRNKEGLENKFIGYGNERSINQLIAHHGIVFKPDSLKVWISCNPYQLGRFICYDLNKVFQLAAGKSKDDEIYSKEFNLESDSFLKSRSYRLFIQFRAMKETIQLRIKNEEASPLPDNFFEQFIQCNSENYEVYVLIGDYFKSRKNLNLAQKYYEIALNKNIATKTEEDETREKLKKIRTENER